MLGKKVEVAPAWSHPKRDDTWLRQIVKEFRIHPVTAQIFVSRGFNSLPQIHDYLYDKLPNLHNPFLMAQMGEAVERVCLAIERKEAILIYGDNDVDGMSGTALLTDFLRLVGAEVLFHISKPGVLREQLIVEALPLAKQHQCKLLITVDCGITAAKEIATITKDGIDVIVTDHHEPIDQLPICRAILNPKLKDNPYPARDLTGVAVAFKLAHAITNHLIEEDKIPSRRVDLKRYLDLVALGSISDMAPLLGENRILVRYGMKQLRKTKRIGLAKLISVADVELSQVTTFTIASKIAPRLNSLGRIADPRKGVEILLIRNSQAAEKMAEELDLNNIERQKIERTISSDIESMVTTNPEILKQHAIVMHSDKWHPGVIAILSTRISKMHNRPTAIIAIEGTVGKGSLRSIPQFPLLPFLKQCADILINFGGHDFAAGMSIKKEHIETFKERFIKAANRVLTEEDVQAKLMIDAEVQFKDLTFDLMESIRLFEPFGNENPQPLLYTKATQAWPPKVMGNHLKLFLEQDDRMLEGIAFGKASMSRNLRQPHLILEVIFTPQINAQNQSIHLLIRDFKVLEKK